MDFKVRITNTDLATWEYVAHNVENAETALRDAQRKLGFESQFVRNIEVIRLSSSKRVRYVIEMDAGESYSDASHVRRGDWLVALTNCGVYAVSNGKLLSVTVIENGCERGLNLDLDQG